MPTSMRIGYSYWGFLGDYKMDAAGNTISAPDGNATYGWSLIWEMQRRGHAVFAMQEDRDWNGVKRWGTRNFDAFSMDKRYNAYRELRQTFGSSEILPELDVLLVEWRFPIVGRNCTAADDNGISFEFDFQGMLQEKFQPDLWRQVEILRHYKDNTKTKIIFWDLDHKLTDTEERWWQPDAVFETSHSPRKLFKERTRVEPPFHIPDLLQHPTLPSDPTRKMVYIGNRYERDDIIDEWLGPVSKKYPGEVEFHGKWEQDAKDRWPDIKMGTRCTVTDFAKIYGTAGACPLLAKRSYLETGFITPRPWEALLFGTLPVGLSTSKGIEQYVEFVAHNGDDMIEVAETLAGADLKTRDEYRRANVEKLEFMDARHFVDKVEAVVQSSPASTALAKRT